MVLDPEDYTSAGDRDYRTAAFPGLKQQQSHVLVSYLFIFVNSKVHRV